MKECVFMGVKAGVRTEDAPSDVKDVWSAQGFSDPEQTVSYLTCHDNLALRDMIESYGIVLESDEAKRLQAYGNSIVMISQGISFIHGGEEFGRTKVAAGKDKHNTYNTTTGANDFKWSLKSDAGWNEVYNSYVAYTQMRKEHPAFRMTNAKDINANVTLDEKSSDETVIININGKAVNDTWGSIKVVMNSSAIDVDVAGVEGMTKVADGKTVGDKVLDNNKAAAQSVSIWAVVNADTKAKSHEQLYYIGATNSWGDHEAMTYDPESGAWRLPVTLTTGKEEWLIKTAKDSWIDDITFSPCTADSTALCAKSNGGGSDDAKFSSTSGEHILIIYDATMKWTLEEPK